MTKFITTRTHGCINTDCIERVTFDGEILLKSGERVQGFECSSDEVESQLVPAAAGYEAIEIYVGSESDGYKSRVTRYQVAAWKVEHGEAVPVTAAADHAVYLVLPDGRVSYCGDAWTVDELIAHLTEHARGEAESEKDAL